MSIRRLRRQEWRAVMYAAIPAMIVGAGVSDSDQVWVAVVGFAVAASVGYLETIVLLRRLGRDEIGVRGDGTFAPFETAGRLSRIDPKQLESLATIEFAPPPDIDPWCAGLLWAGESTDDQMASWLVQVAVDGYVRIDNADRRLAIVPLDRAPGYPSALLDQMFNGRDRIELGRYDKDFEQAWRALRKELDGWPRQSSMWVSRSFKETRLATGAGIGAIALGSIVAWINADSWFANLSVWKVLIIGVASLLLGVSVALAVGSGELVRKSATGTAMWLRVASFRRFLLESESRHVAEAAKRSVVREYAPWSVALGLTPYWTNAITKSGTWRETGTNSDLELLDPSVAAVIAAITNTPWPPPESKDS